MDAAENIAFAENAHFSFSVSFHGEFFIVTVLILILLILIPIHVVILIATMHRENRNVSSGTNDDKFVGKWACEKKRIEATHMTQHFWWRENQGRSQAVEPQWIVPEVFRGRRSWLRSPCVLILVHTNRPRVFFFFLYTYSCLYIYIYVLCIYMYRLTCNFFGRGVYDTAVSVILLRRRSTKFYDSGACSRSFTPYAMRVARSIIPPHSSRTFQRSRSSIFHYFLSTWTSSLADDDHLDEIFSRYYRRQHCLRSMSL